MAKTRRNVQIHASCVSMFSGAALLLGNSGSGKSDLALRLIDQGGMLISDDQVALQKKNSRLFASAPHNIQGLLEVRGAGIFTLPYVENIPVVLAVSLAQPSGPERLPELTFFDCPMICDCKKLQVPLLFLNAFESSTPAKIRLFMSSL